MFRKSLAAISALALVAGTMPASVTTAGELKANQKRQRMLLPAVQKVPRITRGGALKWGRPITVGGNGTEKQSKTVVPPGSVQFFTDFPR